MGDNENDDGLGFIAELLQKFAPETTPPTSATDKFDDILARSDAILAQLGQEDDNAGRNISSTSKSSSSAKSTSRLPGPSLLDGSTFSHLQQYSTRPGVLYQDTTRGPPVAEMPPARASKAKNHNFQSTCRFCKRIYYGSTQGSVNRTRYRHEKRFHANLLNFQFQCVVCGEAFNTEKNLKYHQSTLHQEFSELLGIQKDPFECKLCEEKFIDYIERRKHWNAVHDVPLDIFPIYERKYHGPTTTITGQQRSGGHDLDLELLRNIKADNLLVGTGVGVGERPGEVDLTLVASKSEGS